MLLGLLASEAAIAADEQLVAKTLFTNVNIFDGENEALINNANVLVEGHLIKRVSTDAIGAEGATVIDGKGRTLMPGLIDAHWHTSFCCAPQTLIFTGDVSELAIRGMLGAKDTLLRGFTTVRDAGKNFRWRLFSGIRWSRDRTTQTKPIGRLSRRENPERLAS